MAVQEAQMHWADYLVTVITLLVSLAIGVFFALFKGGQKTKEGYLLGERKMGMGPVCLSLFVTFQSAISLIGFPADTYNTGTMTAVLYVGIAASYVIGLFTVLPLMWPLRLISAYHYLQMRYQSTAVRLMATLTGMLQTLMYMAIALYSPALALKAAAGLPLWVSVVIVGVVGTTYTAIGGIKSVVWTDAFQTVIVFVGIGSVLIKGIIEVGGFGKMTDIAIDGGRIVLDTVDPKERHSYWSTVIGTCVMWMALSFNQSTVQRICSMKSLHSAKGAYLWNVPLCIVYGVTLALTGVLLYSYMVTIGCDFYAAGYVQDKNEMMPYFVIHVLSDLPGLAGIYMSMLFSGALSTFSSGINALAANTVEDLLASPLKGVKDATVTVIAKVIVVVYGAVTVGLAYLVRSLDGPVTQLASSAFGALGSPILGVFFLAAAVPGSNKYGAGGGIILGLCCSLWITMGCTLYGAKTPSLHPGPVHNCQDGSASLALHNQSMASTTISTPTSTIFENNSTVPASSSDFGVYDISYLWFACIGFTVSLLSGIIISAITGWTDKDNVDPRLLFPFCRKLYGIPEPEAQETTDPVKLLNIQSIDFKLSTLANGHVTHKSEMEKKS